MRTKESLNASASFALVILVLFSFAFDLDREEFYAISGGLLWLVYSFAGALIVNRSFARELPNDCLDVLIASPAPGWAIFLGKALAAFFLLMIVEADLAAGLRPVLQHSLDRHLSGRCSLVMLLATWGITVVGAAFSAVTVNVRLRELMLPVLLYPLLIPLLIARHGHDHRAAQRRACSRPISDLYLRLLIVFDVIYTSLALYLIEFILVV